MSIECGIKKYKSCNKSKCLKAKCEDYIIVYTNKDFNNEVLSCISEIYSTFSIKQIKSHSKSNSLISMRSLASHYKQFKGDPEDVYYLAGTIVLLQQHMFKACSTQQKINGYKFIKRQHLYIDKRMERDYKKAIKVKERIERRKRAIKERKMFKAIKERASQIQ